MENNHSATSSDSRSPLFLFVIIIVFALVGLFIGIFAGQVAVLPFYDFDINKAMNFLANPIGDETGRTPLLLVQGVTSLFAFILAPLLYLYYYERKSRGKYLSTASPLWPALLLTVLISQAFMFVNSPIIEWNMNIDFPDFMSSFESYAQQQEQYLRRRNGRGGRCLHQDWIHPCPGKFLWPTNPGGALVAPSERDARARRTNWGRRRSCWRPSL